MAKLARAADDQSEEVFRNQSEEVKQIVSRSKGTSTTVQCRKKRLRENEICKHTLWYVLANFHIFIDTCYTPTFSQQLKSIHQQSDEILIQVKLSFFMRV